MFVIPPNRRMPMTLRSVWFDKTHLVAAGLDDSSGNGSFMTM